MEISFIKLIQGVNKLAEFNSRLKEYVILNMDTEDVAEQATELLDKMLSK